MAARIHLDVSFRFCVIPFLHACSFFTFAVSFISRIHLSITFYLRTGMDMISLEGKTNFFEKRVAEYQKSGVMASLKSSEGGKKAAAGTDLNFDADF